MAPDLTMVETAELNAAHCINCNSTDTLFMFPFRMWDESTVKGFFFICGNCVPKIRGRKFYFEFVKDLKDLKEEIDGG